MSTQQINMIEQPTAPQELHKQSVDTNGLDDIFKWASDIVADDHVDGRARLAREKRVREQVLAVVQKSNEEKVLTDANREINYLQKRVIALLTTLQEKIEENSLLKQIMLTQLYSLQQIPTMEAELRELKAIQCEKESAVSERRYLMDGLTKLKVERDYLEGVLISAETENYRLAKVLRITREELTENQNRKWWQGIHSSIEKLKNVIMPIIQKTF